MFCEKCGKEMPDDAAVCTGCGRSVQLTSSAMPQKDRSVKRASLGLLLGVLIGGFIVVFVGFILFLIGVNSYSYNAGVYVISGLALLFIGFAGIIFGSVLFCIYLYRAWKMIQDGYAYATPREAVGFLFIPFYNLYWYFQAFWRWSKDYNSFIQRNAISAPRMPEGLFLTWAIIIIPASLPLISYFAAIPAIIIALICMTKMCKAINFFASRSE
jgi:hypothetical protein